MNNNGSADTIESLKAQVSELRAQHDADIAQHIADVEKMAHMSEIIRLDNIALFARKREQLSQRGAIGEQMSLFDEVELEHAISEEKAKAVEDKADGAKPFCKKAKSPNLVHDRFIESLPRDERKVDFPVAPIGSARIGYRVVTKLCYTPARYRVSVISYETRKLSDGTIVCMQPESDSMSVYQKAMADTSVVSHVISDKFLLSVPLYRQEQHLAMKGIRLSRQTMSNLIFSAADALSPVGDLMDAYVKAADCCRADETRLNIIEINGGKARIADPELTCMSYVWLFMTADGFRPCCCYHVGPGRQYHVASDYFGEAMDRRYLQTDDYGAYFGLKGVVNVPCWSHIRRRFFAASQAGRKDYVSASSNIVAMIDRMFHEERLVLESLKGREGEKGYFGLRKAAREDRVRPLMEAVMKEIESLSAETLPKSLLGGAVAYAMSLKDHVYSFFGDGRLQLTNNDAERDGIKPLVIGRKNWLFSNTVRGAEVSCLMYSLVETARQNGLDPELYIDWLLRELPYRETKGFPYSDYLPWSDKVPDGVRAKKKSNHE